LIEGVENLEDIKLLVELGCDNFQGYYFGKAEPLSRCLEFIKTGYYKEKILNSI
jgi:EAL domain-containing protein (putative c-di-GMP-specific phosphodiesterase class I)